METNPKYEFTGHEIEYCGRVLRQIRALRAIGSIEATNGALRQNKHALLVREYGTRSDLSLSRTNRSSIAVGTVGGYIENEANLSHEGNCWVFENGLVMDDAIVMDNARVDCVVKDSAVICDNASCLSSAGINVVRVIGDHAQVGVNSTLNGMYRISGHSSLRLTNTLPNNGTTILQDVIVHDAQLIGNTTLINCKIIGKAEITDSKLSSTVILCSSGFRTKFHGSCLRNLVFDLRSASSSYTEAPVGLDLWSHLTTPHVIYNLAHVIAFSNFGSRAPNEATSLTAVYNAVRGTIHVQTGCYSGTLDEFRERLSKLTEQLTSNGGLPDDLEPDLDDLEIYGTIADVIEARFRRRVLERHGTLNIRHEYKVEDYASPNIDHNTLRVHFRYPDTPQERRLFSAADAAQCEGGGDNVPDVAQ